MPSVNSTQTGSVASHTRSVTSVMYDPPSVNVVVSQVIGRQAIDGSTLRVSVKTPNHRKLVSEGAVLPDNPLVFERTRGGRIVGGTLTTQHPMVNGHQRVELRDVCETAYSPTFSSDPFTVSHHASKLISKAKGAQWNAPVFFTELGKTADMVVKGAERIVKMGLALRKGNFARFVDMFHGNERKRLGAARSFNRAQRRFFRDYGRDPQSAFASTWLEYKYGWTPFVLDVHNAFETLSELEQKPLSQVGTVRSTLKLERDIVLDASQFMTFAGTTVGGRAVTKSSQSSRCVWRFAVKDHVNTIGKLGLTNPLEVAWELVPLSFVADWFLPIGDYIAALDAPLRFQHVGGTLGYREVLETKISLRPPPNVSISPTNFKGASRVRVTVKPLTGIPSMALQSMVFDPNLQHGRAISAIALLHTFFGGTGRSSNRS